jgi:type I restriction enzyme M protein
MFNGVDKDEFLAKVTKAYMAIVGDGRGDVFCDNALLPPSDWKPPLASAVELGTFDVVVTNPPFGKNIRVRGNEVLGQYALGRKWTFDKNTRRWEQGSKLLDSQTPQLLFLERCLQLLKTGGRLGIVLPESVFGMPSHQYVVQYLRSIAKVRGVITMPEALFKTSGKGGTHARVCIVLVENVRPYPGEDYDIFFADVKWCGHDSRGNPTIRVAEDGSEELLDDVPGLAEKFQRLMPGLWR